MLSPLVIEIPFARAGEPNYLLRRCVSNHLTIFPQLPCNISFQGGDMAKTSEDDGVLFRPIAYVRSGFHSKFAIPRQSGLVDSTRAFIEFCPPYRKAEALRGLEMFSHLWLLWIFHQAHKASSLTVRPPRLGGDRRLGVFATRSPFRPNPIGLSSVKIIDIDENTSRGPIITVAGADLVDKTPLIDIKPYIHNDCRRDIRDDFTQINSDYECKVTDPCGYLEKIPQTIAETIMGIIAQDPRPAYHCDPTRIYGFEYDDYHIAFQVDDRIATIITIDML